MHKRLLFFTLFILFSLSSYAQIPDTSEYVQENPEPSTVNETRNVIKMAPGFTRGFFGYERAVDPNISLGLKAGAFWGRFVGFSGSAFTRVYSHQFNQNSFFFEMEAMYGYYFPTVFATETNGVYYGEHSATIHYLSGSALAGYKVHIGKSKAVLFEFTTGLRMGKAFFGPDDNLFDVTSLSSIWENEDVQEAFYQGGPGFPFIFKVWIGWNL